jgi:hypothetical protein
MELFTGLFGHLLAFVYHCFDRIVIHGYLTRLSRPEHVVYFFREVTGAPVITNEILSERTNRYQNWVEAFARNRRIPIEWAEKGIRKEDFVRRWQRRMVRNNAYGVYFIFKSLEVGPTFRITVPKYPTKDPNYRIVANQRSRFTHYCGDVRILLELEVRRIDCRSCGKVKQERLDFLADNLMNPLIFIWCHKRQQTWGFRAA